MFISRCTYMCVYCSIKNKNKMYFSRTGERTYPWGTPLFSTSCSERNPPKLTRCGQSVRNSLNQILTLWLIFRSKSRWSNACGWIETEGIRKIHKKYSHIRTSRVQVIGNHVNRCQRCIFNPAPRPICKLQWVQATGNSYCRLVTHIFQNI